jgi:hypothetical protein
MWTSKYHPPEDMFGPEDETDEVIEGEATVVEESQEAALVPASAANAFPDPLEDYLDPVWNRQPGEPVKAYAGFLTYRNLPSGRRTVGKACKLALTGSLDGPAKARTGSFTRWASEWKWAERALAFDKHLADEAAQQWIKRDLDRREADYAVADKIREIAQVALDKAEPDKMSAMQAAKLALVASELQQVALDGIRPQAGKVKELLDAMPQGMRERVVSIVMAKMEI